MAHTKWEPALGTTSGSQRADVIERLYILYVGVRDVRERCIPNRCSLPYVTF